MKNSDTKFGSQRKENKINTLIDFILISLSSGFGTGFIRYAPGTFGTTIGFFIWSALISFGSAIYFILSVILIFFISVFISGWSAKRYSEKDPKCVVIDEWAAFTFVLSPWPFILSSQFGEWPELQNIFSSSKSWFVLLIYFLSFRFFDILKPLGIAKLQNLDGGWGITIDDYAAAIPASVIGSLCLLFC